MTITLQTKIDNFFSKYPVRIFEKKQIIVYSGVKPEGVFYLESGIVRQYDISDNGHEVVVNVFKSPSFFPIEFDENSKFSNQYYYQAMSEINVRVTPKKDVINFIKSNPDVMFDLLSRIHKGTLGMQRKLAHAMGGSSKSRVLFELVIACKRFGVLQKDGSYFLEIHEDELAKRTGLARETTNRQISQLKSQNLIKINHKYIVIKDLCALEELLGDHL